jgi:hypothetical protein
MYLITRTAGIFYHRPPIYLRSLEYRRQYFRTQYVVRCRTRTDYSKHNVLRVQLHLPVLRLLLYYRKGYDYCRPKY